MVILFFKATLLFFKVIMLFFEQILIWVKYFYFLNKVALFFCFFYNFCMKTYLITGGLGFIGLNYIKSIISNKNNFVINFDKKTYASNDDIFLNYKNYKFIKGDISNKKQVEKVFIEFDVDYVINFAAESHVDNSYLFVESFIKSNILGVSNLLGACKKYWKNKKNKRFVQISTDEVYGESSLPCQETDKTNPSSPYAITKTCAEQIVLSFFKTYNLPVLITRSSNNFGEYQHPEKLIPKVFLSLSKNQPFSMYKNCKFHQRSWLYVSDNVNAINLVLKKGKVGEIYNIASNIVLTNDEIVNLVISFLKQNTNFVLKKNLIEEINARPFDDKCYKLNFDKIKKLGYAPKNFEESFLKTMNFYKNNLDYLIKQSKKHPK